MTCSVRCWIALPWGYCVYTVRDMDQIIITTNVVPTCRCSCSLLQNKVVVWQKKAEQNRGVRGGEPVRATQSVARKE